MPGITNLQVNIGGGSDQDGQYMAINGMGASGTLYLIDGVWNIDPGAMLNVYYNAAPGVDRQDHTTEQFQRPVQPDGRNGRHAADQERHANATRQCLPIFS